MGLGNWIDSAVAIVAPGRAVRRRRDRFALGHLKRIEQNARRFARHRGADTTRMRDSWNATAGSGDFDILDDLDRLRDRSRDIERNDAYGAGAVGTKVSNVVGTGLRPQSRIDAEALRDKGLDLSEDEVEKLQRQAERAFKRWAESVFADSGNRMSFNEIQSLVFRRSSVDGDVLVLPQRLRGPRGRRHYSLALQVVEGDRLKTPAGLQSSPKVRKGIHVGKRGEALNYYICKVHPGDDPRFWTPKTTEDFHVIRAFDKQGRPNVLHIYDVVRTGQRRGRPFMAPILGFVRDLGKYLEAEVYAKRMEACIGMVYKFIDSYADSTNNYNDTDGNSSRVRDQEPGMEIYLQPGEDVVPLNPSRPGSSFEPFTELFLRAIGSGLGLSYELVARDFSKVNYSSARASLLESRRGFRVAQKSLITHLGQPVWELFLEEAFLRGEFPAPRFYDFQYEYTRAHWIPPGWEWVDPVKEAKGSVISMQHNLSTLGDELAARGKDPDETLEENARIAKKKKKLGLVDPPPEPLSGRSKPKPDDEDDDEKGGPRVKTK